MSLGTYWRLTLLVPAILPFVVVGIVGAFANAIYASSDPVMRPDSTGALLREIAIDGIRTGVWPAYGAWCFGFLGWSRRLPGARLRRAAWWAPVSFAPLLPIAWAIADAAIGRQRSTEDFAIGAVAFVLDALVAGYLVVVLAYAFEQLGWAQGWVRRT